MILRVSQKVVCATKRMSLTKLKKYIEYRLVLEAEIVENTKYSSA